MIAKVKKGIIEVTTHWEMEPGATNPSFVLIKQNDEILCYEQFAPPNREEKR